MFCLWLWLIPTVRGRFLCLILTDRLATSAHLEALGPPPPDTHWHTLSLAPKGSSSQHTALAFPHVRYFLPYVINYSWDSDCLDVNLRQPALSVLNCYTWIHCLPVFFPLDKLSRNVARQSFLLLCIILFAMNQRSESDNAILKRDERGETRQAKQDPPLNAPLQSLVRRCGLVAIRKPRTAAGSLGFQLWNLAHPSCKPPTDSIFNHFKNLWGSHNQVSIPPELSGGSCECARRLLLWKTTEENQQEEIPPNSTQWLLQKISASIPQRWLFYRNWMTFSPVMKKRCINTFLVDNVW